MAPYLKIAYELKELMNADERFILLNEKEKAMENDNQQTLDQYENEHGISLSQLRELLRDIKTLLAELNAPKEEKERKI